MGVNVCVKAVYVYGEYVGVVWNCHGPDFVYEVVCVLDSVHFNNDGGEDQWTTGVTSATGRGGNCSLFPRSRFGGVLPSP